MTSARKEAERLAQEVIDKDQSSVFRGDIRTLIADLLEPLLAGREWQSMESAPQDGTSIIAAVLVHNNKTNSHYWDRHIVWFDGDRGEIDQDCEQGWAWDDYTHWLPLPAPPTKENG